MNNPATIATRYSQTGTLATNKVIRNTYTLLSVTLYVRPDFVRNQQHYPRW